MRPLERYIDIKSIVWGRILARESVFYRAACAVFKCGGISAGPQELAERYGPLLHLPAAALGGALETVRLQALRRGRGNATFRETQVATLELLLPRGCKEVRITAATWWLWPLQLLQGFCF